MKQKSAKSSSNIAPPAPVVAPKLSGRERRDAARADFNRVFEAQKKSRQK
jgi:hypothetical protein